MLWRLLQICETPAVIAIELHIAVQLHRRRNRDRDEQEAGRERGPDLRSSSQTAQPECEQRRDREQDGESVRVPGQIDDAGEQAHADR